MIKNNKISSSFIASLAILLLSPKSALATSYYVSTAGNDVNAGTSITSPLKTITKCISKVVAGDTCFVRGGTYNETMKVTKSGSATAGFITFKNYETEKPVVDGQNIRSTALVSAVGYVKIDGFSFVNSNSFQLESVGSDNIYVSNCEGSYSLNGGFVFRNGSNIFVDSSNIHHSNQAGLSADHEAVSFSNINGFELKNSQIHDGGEEGVDAKYGSSNGKIHHNKIYSNRGPNLYLDGASNINAYSNEISVTTTTSNDKSNITLAVENSLYKVVNINIYNNIIRNALGGVSFYVDPGIAVSSSNFSNINIYNNIFYKNTTRGAIRLSSYSSHISNLQVKNNIFWGNSTNFDNTSVPIIAYNLFGSSPAGTNAITSTTSGFVSEVANSLDFHPVSTSKSIDAGYDVGSIVSTDFDGNARPQGTAFDIGPFEYLQGVVVNPSPSPLPSPAPKPGDANGDNLVNEADYAVWKNSYLTKPASLGSIFGDFNGSGIVDGVDYIIWASNYGK